MNTARSFFKTIPIVACMMFLVCDAWAQPTDKKQRIETFKISYITKQLNLTPDEAKTFWPVYNEYEMATEEVRGEFRRNVKENRGKLNELSDKEVEELIDSQIANKQRELDIQKSYHAQFKGVLPVKKVAKLYVAEHEFKKILLKEMQSHRGGGQHKGPGGPGGPKKF